MDTLEVVALLIEVKAAGADVECCDPECCPDGDCDCDCC